MNLSPILISLKTAVLSLVIVFPLGTILAWRIMGLSRRRLKFVLDSILTLPLVLPPTVAGLFLLCVFGVNRPVGHFFLEVFHVKIAFSFIATVIASAFVSFPLMYRSARGAFDQVNPDLADAARTLGFSELRIFIQVLLPNSLPGLLSGSVLAFARGLGEFGATAMLAGNIAGKTRTLPLAVYSETAAGRMDTALIYAAILMVFAFAALLLISLAGTERWKSSAK